MNRLRFAVALLAVGIAPVRPTAGQSTTAAPDVMPTITVRTYAAQQEDLPAAGTTALASSLLAQAGIRLQAVACGARVPDPECASPLTPTELAMRLIRERRGAPLPVGASGKAEVSPYDKALRRHGDVDVASGEQAMGSSMIDTVRRTGSFATLYLDRIEALARSSGVSAAVVFARALVHETAHLVLGTNEHGASGLMRPLWSREMLRTEADGEWVFTAEEGTRLRAALLARFVAAPRSGPVNVTH